MTGVIGRSGIIADADVLIDYAQSAPFVLRLISQHIQKLYVALPVFKEVDQLGKAEAKALELEIVEPALGQLIEAEKTRRDIPQISGQDAINFAMARDKDWICLTNDKQLRKICLANKVECVWGLQIMLSLVSAKKLTGEKAIRIAKDIHLKNNRITPKIIEDFRSTIVRDSKGR